MSITKSIKSGVFKNIIIASGAGVSTNAGIPDYRTSGYSIPISDMKTKNPTAGHYLAGWLYNKGWLKRVYTQNVDGLYQKTGLPDNMVVEFHGSLHKNNVVNYNNSISSEVIKQTTIDFNEDCDLIIVMGTSLQVAPFCALPNLVKKSCTRILVNLRPQDAFTNNWSKKTHTPEGMYDTISSPRSDTKIGNRKVSLRPQWGKNSKWKSQHIIKEDCDVWSGLIMN